MEQKDDSRCLTIAINLEKFDVSERSADRLIKKAVDEDQLISGQMQGQYSLTAKQPPRVALAA